MHKILQPDNWVAPIGYSNGISARGRTIFVGGQIGWNEQCEFETDDFVEQVRQTLKNIVAILAVDGAGPEHITTMTWYFTDKQEYKSNMRGLGQAYRDVIGKHFPAMAAMQVAGLIEDRAKIEIQVTAVVPD
ncbi:MULTISPECIES: RidA family protein [Pseudochrobactrum]|jgi:enamine deaminase RidA (YjgF/YER057c/UK114 family)|uniref:Enamine deaminase RidA (YjgF/YER057c/UK114 family) n=3 Tax=Brucellaceae TaxID=118882 RepID=A0A366E084_9HYPH|nr:MULTISPECIES: RidA family protein [Pseudochrobactrum]MBX8800066.1 RidA family protein [Ochrobactrum sp. MR28]MBX8816386.1 RidA family protein [Ochrobactrum sp. MR31]MCF7672053.1 RidA family protein [Bacillus subtilis]MDR2310241.1 RidA family protein [Brucellaceae bacterium]MCF7645441.1 RidA family protein [Pseudochrobactrum asaccharolyticum]